MPPPKWRRRRPGDREQFSVPIRKSDAPRSPEILPWYWHPDRLGVNRGPEAFQKQLAEIDKDLAVVFSPVHDRWLIWVRNPRMQNSVCPGWQMLFLWEHPTTHAFLPLNELVFHNLFHIMAHRFPNARTYYESISRDIDRQREERNRAYTNDREALQGEIYDSQKISTAGKGNKFAQHHSGTIVESPSQIAERQESRRWRLPSDMLKQIENEKEQAFYGR